MTETFRWPRALPRFSRRRSALLLALPILLALGACGSPRGAPVRVIVPRGATFREAADSLSRAGIVRFPAAFRMYARLVRKDRDIKPGTYLLRRGSRWAALVTALNGGRGVISSVTIPEGFTIAQISPLLVRMLGVPADSVTAAVRDSGLRARVGAPAATLEGYLFPDTYAFPAGTTARQAVTEMLMRFEREWTPAWSAQLATVGLTRNDAVTMASIVEREARLPKERPVIAGVYYNRLRIGMPLQADPTVQYALGRRVPRLLYRDLATPSPYNTYLQRGLPPGPIASPGRASLLAALYPATVPYLYFVANADGHHEFRTTLAEHNRAKLQAESTFAR